MNPSVVREASIGSQERCPRVVITEATSFIARSLAYRILSDEIFGADQEIVLSLYDSGEQAMLLQTVAIEITACAPNLLKDVVYSSDTSLAFAGADWVFFIGKSRDYNFSKSQELQDDPFFIESVLETKKMAIALEKFAKIDVKIITLGNTSARLISEYAPSIPKNNITGVTLVLQRLAASAIAKKTGRLPSDVKNLIIWGTNSRSVFPYCGHAKFSDEKSVINEICDDKWFKKTLPKLVEGVFRKCRYRISEALALAEHCKLLVQGTPPGEWTCMSVVSDGSYDVTPGHFFSFPLYCRDGNWEIVRDLYVEDYCKRIIKDIIVALDEKIEAALKICRRANVSSIVSRKSLRKSIIKIT
ncbi:malate dehydrogenase, cytoplasmic-like [Nasonia vitripennis]|uniref:Lactate/malate dehydrogenase C-terminal domain-containing protein n=1 Tax=Nasonia vitripennis TaxID=7425 RepID=A0A7M7IN02_NASVI|nr:malate dehydrogenase, cytoplasmic-like [Nasonia vitripennis]